MKYRVVKHWGSYKAQFKFLGFWVDYHSRHVFKTPEAAEDYVRSNELRKRGTGAVVREFNV
jgi:hypothetical protein